MATGKTKLQPESPLPVYVISGSEDFLRAQELRRLTEDLLGTDPDPMAIAEFDGETADVAAVLDECRTPSLLSPLRVVIVREADDFLSRVVADDVKARELLEKYLGAPSPGGVLILVCRSWPKSTRLYKIVEKIGHHAVCDTPKPQAIPGWLTGRAKDAYRCSLDGMAARRLYEQIGAHLGLLDMELGKLATYVAPRTSITTEDVDALVGASREEKVFKITDAVGRKNPAEALEVWQQVLATDRSAPYRAIGGLAYGFRRLTEAKRMIARGVTLQNAKDRLRIFEDTGSLKRQLDRFSLGEWENHLGQLLRIDVENKTGLGWIETSVEKFIVGLCR